jgi:Na+/H+-dicarboxylate symporter
MKRNRLTIYILVAMLLGIGVGYWVHVNSSQETIQKFATNVKLLTTVFLRLVQMIIAPLVFCTLVVGISKLGDLKTVGRVGGKALLWFVSASLVSLFLGMILVNFFQPGHAIHLGNLADDAGAKELIGKTQEFSLQKFVEHVVPKSVFESMANNEILQLVVFSIFFARPCKTGDQSFGCCFAHHS